MPHESVLKPGPGAKDLRRTPVSGDLYTYIAQVNIAKCCKDFFFSLGFVSPKTALLSFTCPESVAGFCPLIGNNWPFSKFQTASTQVLWFLIRRIMHILVPKWHNFTRHNFKLLGPFEGRFDT